MNESSINWKEHAAFFSQCVVFFSLGMVAAWLWSRRDSSDAAVPPP